MFIDTLSTEVLKHLHVGNLPACEQETGGDVFCF